MNDATIRAAAIQALPGTPPGELPLSRLEQEEVRVAVLPEFFWVRPSDQSVHDAADHAAEDLETLADLSLRLDRTIWVGGTVIERGDDGRLFNSCFVFAGGAPVGRYRKRRLMPGEAAAGLSTGNESLVVELPGISIGVLICADVFEPEHYAALASRSPDLIAIPTNSPFRPDDSPEEKALRDETWFVSGARTSGAWVLKACTAGSVFGRPVQGRSLVASPDGVVARVPPEGERDPALLIVDIPSRQLL